MSTLMELCEILEMEHLDRGSTIELGRKDKKCIFFLKKGTIKIVNLETDSVKYVVKKGNIFGELALYDNASASEEKAITLEDSVVCYIDALTMEKLMNDHSSLKNGVLKIYGLRIKKLERRLSDLLYKDSASRIKEFIIHYIHEFGEVQGDRVVAKNLLSHKDISNLANTSRQTASNVLSGLRKNDFIAYDAKYISIPVDDQSERTS